MVSIFILVVSSIAIIFLLSRLIKMKQEGKLLQTLRDLLIIFLAPTEVAKILSLGNIGFGSITTNFLKLKFFIDRAQAPIFSPS